MADEATLMIETELPIPFTCANGTGIEKGAILTMTDPMTAATCVANADIVAGIAAEEKIANDGKTSISVYRRGTFKVKASGSIGVGAAVITDGAGDPNEFITAGVDAENIAGIALETATDGETFLMELGPRTINVA